jgi:flagellar biogenesis protein FliO
MSRVDFAVEPATFQAIGDATPLAAPEVKLSEPAMEAAPEPKPIPEAVETAKSVPQEACVSTTSAESPTPQAASPSAGRLTITPSEGPAPRQRPALAQNPFEGLLAWRPSPGALTATGAVTAIVVGLLLSFIWLLRSLQPRASRQLPKEVVEVLGRAPLAGKQTTQLVRVGHKLLLIAITPDGAKPLTEITDPDEVAQLISACDAGRGRGSTAEFDALLRQMETERTSPGFLDSASQRRREPTYGLADGAFDPRTLAAAYANTPGGRGDG